MKNLITQAKRMMTLCFESTSTGHLDLVEKANYHQSHVMFPCHEFVLENLHNYSTFWIHRGGTLKRAHTSRLEFVLCISSLESRPSTAKRLSTVGSGYEIIVYHEFFTRSNPITTLHLVFVWLSSIFCWVKNKLLNK